MSGGPTMVGEFVEVVPYERIVFTFGWDSNEPGTALAPGTTRVAVILQRDGADTVLTLRHTDMPASQADDHQRGWEHFLTILAERADRGV